MKSVTKPYSMTLEAKNKVIDIFQGERDSCDFRKKVEYNRGSRVSMANIMLNLC